MTEHDAYILVLAVLLDIIEKLDKFCPLVFDDS